MQWDREGEPQILAKLLAANEDRSFRWWPFQELDYRAVNEQEEHFGRRHVWESPPVAGRRSSA